MDKSNLVILSVLKALFLCDIRLIVSINFLHQNLCVFSPQIIQHYVLSPSSNMQSNSFGTIAYVEVTRNIDEDHYSRVYSRLKISVSMETTSVNEP